MSWILDNYVNILAATSAVIAAATAITKLTPSKRDDEVVSKVRKVLEFISIRLGK